MGHIPSSLISGGKLALKLLGRYSLFSGTNQVDRQKPLSQGQMGIVKDGPGSHGKIIFAIHALIEVAHLAGFARGVILKDSLAPTADANDPLGPADARKVLDALLFGIKPLKNFKDGRVLIHSLTPFPDIWLEDSTPEIHCQGDNRLILYRLCRYLHK